MFYPVRIPWLVKKIYNKYTWHIDGPEPAVYLTFDDGPHPEVTQFVLDELRKYNAKATFFCIGDNVQKYPEMYKQVLMEGHRIGNHTQNHLNGWEVDDDVYIKNVYKAAELIDSDLFRPPYGKITNFQAKLLMGENLQNKRPYRIIMWDVLSGDFDRKITGEQCLENVIRKTRKGSIITFHDSERAYPRLKIALPEAMKYLSGKGFVFKSIS
jgi:peptidoglycan/xylan/chitin deacetylase (PgdA/CDA1 family)